MTDLRHYDVIVSPVISSQGDEAGNQGCNRGAFRRQGKGR